jgi:hypothetical protein
MATSSASAISPRSPASLRREHRMDRDLPPWPAPGRKSRPLPDSLVPRQHCKNPGDEPCELLHVAAEERFDGFVRDPSVVRDQASFELNVSLDGVHQRRVAEGENAAQVRWAMAVPILPGDVPMTPDGLRANTFLPSRTILACSVIIRFTNFATRA